MFMYVYLYRFNGFFLYIYFILIFSLLSFFKRKELNRLKYRMYDRIEKKKLLETNRQNVVFHSLVSSDEFCFYSWYNINLVYYVCVCVRALTFEKILLRSTELFVLVVEGTFDDVTAIDCDGTDVFLDDDDIETVEQFSS